MDLSTLNRSAAEIAALALYETFPGIELLGGKRTSLGFSFSLRSSVAFPAEAEVLVEEKMRQIVREDRAMRVLEMVPVSAKALLLKEGHLLQAESLSEASLVEVVQIGGFHALTQGPHLTATSQLQHFKLWPLQIQTNGELQLSGCAFPSKEELRTFLKRMAQYSERSHERIGIKKSLWTLREGQIVYLPEGLKRLHEVTQVLRDHLFEGAFEVNGAGKEAIPLLAKEWKKDRIAEIEMQPRPVWDSEMGLFSGQGGMQATVYFDDLKNNWPQIVISLLQLVEKTLNILGFRHTLCLAGPRKLPRRVQGILQVLEDKGLVFKKRVEERRTAQLHYLVDDALGRSWAAFSIELVEKKGVFVTASVERLTALLIEVKNIENQ